jgi:hypothetical protein
MTADLSTEQVETAARALLDSRIQAVRELATTRQTRNDKREELAAAERADTAAYAAALRAGWTTDELRKVGLDEPERRAPGRPRRPRNRATASDTDAPANGAAAPPS